MNLSPLTTLSPMTREEMKKIETFAAFASVCITASVAISKLNPR
jgi:hypothetical protein